MVRATNAALDDDGPGGIFGNGRLGVHRIGCGLGLPFPAEPDRNTDLYRPTIAPAYGGRRGEHSPEFTELWEEMTSVYRLDPEAVW